MKIIDILNEKVDGTLVDGFKFKHRSNTYTYDKRTGFTKDEEGRGLGDRYCLENILKDEVEVIEENKEIEKLEISESNTEIIDDFVIKNRKKINELVRAVNKLNKERERE